MIYKITLTEEQFDALNHRRVNLINGMISSEERKEFEALQEIAGQVRDANTPPLDPKLVAAAKRLGFSL